MSIPRITGGRLFGALALVASVILGAAAVWMGGLIQY